MHFGHVNGLVDPDNLLRKILFLLPSKLLRFIVEKNLISGTGIVMTDRKDLIRYFFENANLYFDALDLNKESFSIKTFFL